MIPLYIVFSHLVADFILQPAKLVSYKEKHFWGVLIHSGIHFAVSALMLIPYWNISSLWLALLGIGLTHALIDQGKISLQFKTDQYAYPFLLDQLFHFFTLYFFISFFKLTEQHAQLPSNFFFNNIYTNREFLTFLIILIFVTVVYDITEFQLRREKNARSMFHFNTKNLLPRLIVATVVFAGFMLAGYALS